MVLDSAGNGGLIEVGRGLVQGVWCDALGVGMRSLDHAAMRSERSSVGALVAVKCAVLRVSSMAENGTGDTGQGTFS